MVLEKQQQREVKKWREKYYSGVSHDPRWQSLGGKRSRDYLPGRTTLNAQSTRHGARPGPTLAPRCTREPLRTPQPRARETTRGLPSRACKCAKTVRLVHTQYVECRGGEESSSALPYGGGILFCTSVWPGWACCVAVQGAKRILLQLVGLLIGSLDFTATCTVVVTWEVK